MNLNKAKRLSEFDYGERATILKCTLSQFTPKLASLGCKEGSTITILRKSPFGPSYYVKLNGQFIALRLEELESIEAYGGE